MKPAKPFSATMDEQTFVPPTMRALYYCPLPTATDNEGEGNSTSLIFDTDFPVPKPSPSQYLIKVQTAAFSHDEIRLARTLNPTLSVPQIPLHNICGTVISTPSQDHYKPSGPKAKVDDVVFGLVNYTRDGGAADYVLATEDELAFKPQNISAAEAAAIPLPALTAWQALFTYGGLEPGGSSSGNGNNNGGHIHRTSSSGGGGISRISSNISNSNSRSLGIGKKLLPKHHNNQNHPLRIFITNAGDAETALQALHLLRSATLFPSTNKPWICATCSSTEQATYLRTEFIVAETIVAPRPPDPDFDLAAAFRDKRWEPVDFVLDCLGGSIFRQAHSPHVVRDHGVVLTAVDPEPAQNPQWENGVTRGLFSRFVSVEPDGEALGQIARLVEDEQSVRGRAANVVDLVNGGNVLDAGASDALRGKMIVVKVN